MVMSVGGPSPQPLSDKQIRDHLGWDPEMWEALQAQVENVNKTGEANADKRIQDKAEEVARTQHVLQAQAITHAAATGTTDEQQCSGPGMGVRPLDALRNMSPHATAVTEATYATTPTGAVPSSRGFGHASTVDMQAVPAGGSMSSGEGSQQIVASGIPGVHVNPAIAAMPMLAHNTTAMGMAAGVATLGMLKSNASGGGMLAAAAGVGSAALAVPSAAMGVFEGANSGMASVYYGLQSLDTRLRRVMMKQATMQNDAEMMGLLNNPNIPIDKLVALWAFKNGRRSEQELREKMLAAEDARQREKTEKNNQEALASARSVTGGLGQIAGAAVGTAIGGPMGGLAGAGIGGQVGSLVPGLARSAVIGTNLAEMGQQSNENAADPAAAALGLGAQKTPSQAGTAAAVAAGVVNQAVGGVGGGATAESAAQLQLEVQMLMEEWKRAYELASNIAKAIYDASMTPVNNLR
jgi:hypothetical protein